MNLCTSLTGLLTSCIIINIINININIIIIIIIIVIVCFAKATKYSMGRIEQ